MQTSKNKTLISQIKLVAAIAVWGGSFASTKIAVSQAAPSTIIWVRFLIGSFILGIFALKQGDLHIPSWKDALEFMALGYLGITLNQWLQCAGLVTSEAATTAWILASTPVLMAVLSWLFLKEKLGWQAVAGIFVAAFGVIMVVSKGDLRTAFSGGLGQPGDILILISVPVWAVYSIWSCPVLKRHSAIKVTFYTFLFGWLFSNFQFVAAAGWKDLGGISAWGWANILYLSILCSALSYIFYNDALQFLAASQVAAFLNLEPLVATLVAAVMLGERILPATLAGGALILFGVWLVNHKPAPASN
jgi:drug/metabolite transporter (DMT)-like permease